ncbi:hypothetical protein AGABI1DRAFT_126761 [Agaricus bisporus var. burnettii JB137-S8]|uniref:Zn(2)-C6 fungal-type domain-containing protein n=2 Tax=Agaricus bisporus var. burnettii TaxID=192524 RepID=K5XBP6_AGABU|nr:hypothetical protein AGABI2DRAFT_117758 [Agaricus bisporus var. bisporus H97]XP_007328337.1 uncharacterized protein AGABI1DRAFT_126761 [Agaricus bisporus var. burnettii JB137-S8]EKM80713.1 hypothetical protein AGABI1DRAFT_126761 [Agaricus bisporus var. burnettii JB137-S8]EKV47181.1 hypothetical protein AGABI2DRAFT_117758 [Agaricus bisporus var. bisporus H97]KAF7782341.1 transcriptional regulator family: Fungal Specific TF [Agaricus bisporus var. burnettii]
MADSMSYTATNQYLSAQYYPPPTHVGHNHVQHVMQAPPRQDIAPRKRPKYTRSKTGCMTCRVKKIKCDEAKPNCMRCTHGQRECTWPEGVPARKKSTARKDSIDGRPSTANSSLSESSNTPPTREPSPPRRQQQVDLNLMPLTTQRRPNDAYLQLQPIQTEIRSMSNDRSQGYPQQHTHTPASALLSMMPEQAYQPRYDHYSSPTQRTNMQPYRSMAHASLAHWSPPPEQMDPYQYPTLQDRALVAHHTSASDSHRYQ